MGFIAGSYRATWGGLPLGMVENGFTIIQTKKAKHISFDQIGDTIPDSIFTGMDMRIRMSLTEVDLFAVKRLLWDSSLPFGAINRIGESEYVKSRPLTLTACTPVFPDSIPLYNASLITFFNTVLAAENDVSVQLTNRLRKVDVLMMVYPKTAAITGIPQGVRYSYFEAT
jgi:hypothetical protein